MKERRRVEACLGVLMQSSHISDGVERGGNQRMDATRAKAGPSTGEHRYM